MENIPTIHYSPGEIIIREGEPSNSIYLIVSGRVKVTKHSGNKEVLLTTQGKNTIFGEMALIDGKRRSATVTAMEDTYCHKCNSVALVKEIEKLPVDLKVALQSMAKVIRDNNTDMAAGYEVPHKGSVLGNSGDAVTFMSEDEVKCLEVQSEIEKVKDSFIRSLFRVLISMAYEQNEAKE